MQYVVELELEDDGRWLAAIPSMPGVMAYGVTEKDALAYVEALALRVIADQLEHGETSPEHLDVSFVIA
ncbi:type II toxin-antitoxin system HicB family antitoxin [Archangium sp.]|jgi:predicted RNase H-like HicB family nuclease|uniref:type II toxin-antitoxin system HicB family antitoxin n=1 Tax=Archangium sp. TaxID=1872627 RepID=UPI002ED89308